MCIEEIYYITRSSRRRDPVGQCVASCVVCARGFFFFFFSLFGLSSTSPYYYYICIYTFSLYSPPFVKRVHACMPPLDLLAGQTEVWSNMKGTARESCKLGPLKNIRRALIPLDCAHKCICLLFFLFFFSHLYTHGDIHRDADKLLSLLFHI